MNKHSHLLHIASIFALLACTLACGGRAFAQGATPAPFSKVTVSPEAAKKTLEKAVINAATARAIVDACIEWQSAQPGGAVVAIYVLSPSGQIIDAHQMDGITPIGAETALLKAKTVLYARTSSSAVAQRFAGNSDGKLIRLNLGHDEGLGYFFVAGGLPIIADDQLIGAIGVGGGNADEMCAYQALVKVVGPQPPLVKPAPPAAAVQVPAPQR